MKKSFLLPVIALMLVLNSCSKGESEDIVPESTPQKIELTSDKSLYTFGASIEANNIEVVTLLTKVTDQNGDVLNKSCSITLNGVPYSDKTFKTGTGGDYEFQASIGSLKSNTYTINAYETADKYVTLQSSSIQSVNSVGLVTVGITFKNISSKKLKYVNFNVECFNQVNDKMYEEITGKSSIVCQGTGFFSPGETKTLYFDIGYFTGVKSINAKLSMVTLEDGSKIFSYD